VANNSGDLAIDFVVDTSLWEDGIYDLYTGIQVSILKQTQIELALHNFWLPHGYTDIKNKSKITEKFLGTELDFGIHFKPYENTHFSFIHGILFGTPTMDLIKGGDHERISNFAAIILTWNPVFQLSSNE
jgi:hypothetical protein